MPYFHWDVPQYDPYLENPHQKSLPPYVRHHALHPMVWQYLWSSQDSSWSVLQKQKDKRPTPICSPNVFKSTRFASFTTTKKWRLPFASHKKKIFCNIFWFFQTQLQHIVYGIYCRMFKPFISNLVFVPQLLDAFVFQHFSFSPFHDIDHTISQKQCKAIHCYFQKIIKLHYS